MSNIHYNARTYRPKNKKRRKRTKYNIKTILIVFVIVAAFIFGIITRTTPMFNIQKIEVENNNVAKASDIIGRSGIVKGENIYAFSVKDAKTSIKGIDVISSVKIKRKLPSTVVISVEESSPYFIVKIGDKYYSIDKKAKVTDGSYELKHYEVPIVDGLKLKKLEEGSNFFDDNSTNVNIQTIKSVFEFMEEKEFMNIISELHVTEDGDYTIYLEGGSVIKFASYNDFIAHEDFVEYFIKNIGAKQKVELIKDVNPIYSKI